MAAVRRVGLPRRPTGAGGSDRENEHHSNTEVLVFAIQPARARRVRDARRTGALRSISVAPWLRVIPFALSSPFRCLCQLARPRDHLRRRPAAGAQVAHTGVAVRLRQLLRSGFHYQRVM